MIYRGSGVLGEVEDVYLPFAVDNPHADCCVSKGIKRVLLTRRLINLNIPLLQDFPKLTLVGVLGADAALFAAEKVNILHGKAVIEVADQGPGIADIEQAMGEGYSTSGSLGAGLPGTRRLVDRFDLQSSSGGTVVRIERMDGTSVDAVLAEIGAKGNSWST